MLSNCLMDKYSKRHSKLPWWKRSRVASPKNKKKLVFSNRHYVAPACGVYCDGQAPAFGPRVSPLKGAFRAVSASITESTPVFETNKFVVFPSGDVVKKADAD